MTKTRSTKRALLMSALALFLCMSMLVGTTFAWFTDSVTSAGNTIQAGTLDVDLIDEQGKSLAGEVLEFVDLDENDLWEPGCTYTLEKFYVANKGNLDLKYEVVINGIKGNAKLLEAIEWTVNGTAFDFSNLKGELLAGKTSEAFVLSGHMKEDAGNEYQGLTAKGISVSVFATQLTSEADSFGNQYDKEAALEYTYDSAKSAKENAADLQTLIDTAVEGATIVVPAGTYDVSGISGSQIKLTKDNVTLLGSGDVIINDDGEGSSNVQAVIKITGDNVTVSNIYAEDKGENTVILAFGNNVTINNCTLKGYASSAWGQYLEAGVMIVTNDVVNAPITKYTVTNNTFIDCNVSLQNGVGNGGNAEDLIISGNTFKNAGIFIEHNQTNSVTGAVESWHVTDILVLPTIKNNLFESPSVWLGSTPFAMYVRVYRDSDVETMTPASYWTDFVANNTIMDYTGEKVSTDGSAALMGKNGVQMRPNGKVQYYGLDFGNVVETAADLKDALANGENAVLSDDIADAPVNTKAPYGNYYGVALNGGVLDGNGNSLDFNEGELNNGSLDNYGIMVSAGTIKNVDITGVFRGIVIMNPTDDIYIDNVTIGGEDVCYAINTAEGDGAHSLIVTNSTIAGWNSYGDAIKDLSFTNCTFAQGEYYTNVYGRLVKPYVTTVFENCEFSSKYYIDLSSLEDGCTITLKNCTVNGVKLTAENWKDLIVAEDVCGNGQISIEGKDGTYMSTSNIFDYVVID